MSDEKHRILNAVKTRIRESRNLDFKSEFAANSSRDLIEVVKDIVAIANSGGGIVVFGLTSKGEPSGKDVSGISDIDPATITDQIHKYTGEQFSDFEILKVEKAGMRYPAIYVLPVSTPLVFERPGTYAVSDKKQQTAFSKGTIYFRHGAKSEPADNSDIKALIDQ